MRAFRTQRLVIDERKVKQKRPCKEEDNDEEEDEEIQNTTNKYIQEIPKQKLNKKEKFIRNIL